VLTATLPAGWIDTVYTVVLQIGCEREGPGNQARIEHPARSQKEETMRDKYDYETLKYKSTCDGYEVILAKIKYGSPYHPYVTWLRDPKKGVVVHGHYFKPDELELAEKDYANRN
jgi:hypothetical protein